MTFLVVVERGVEGDDISPFQQNEYECNAYAREGDYLILREVEMGSFLAEEVIIPLREVGHCVVMRIP